MIHDGWDSLPRLPLISVEPGDRIFLPKRVAGMLAYDPKPVRLNRVVDCGNGSLVLCWAGGERLYTPSMQDGSPAVVLP